MVEINNFLRRAGGGYFHRKLAREPPEYKKIQKNYRRFHTKWVKVEVFGHDCSLQNPSYRHEGILSEPTAPRRGAQTKEHE
jgi:hypothetical protein